MDIAGFQKWFLMGGVSFVTEICTAFSKIPCKGSVSVTVLQLYWNLVGFLDISGTHISQQGCDFGFGCGWIVTEGQGCWYTWWYVNNISRYFEMAKSQGIHEQIVRTPSPSMEVGNSMVTLWLQWDTVEPFREVSSDVVPRDCVKMQYIYCKDTVYLKLVLT